MAQSNIKEQVAACGQGYPYRTREQLLGHVGSSKWEQLVGQVVSSSWEQLVGGGRGARTEGARWSTHPSNL